MFHKVFEEIAQQNNMTVDEVYLEMQKAISISNPNIKDLSVEEFITFCIHKILENK